MSRPWIVAGGLENPPHIIEGDRAVSNPRWIGANKLTYLIEDDRTVALHDIANGKRTIIGYDIAGGHTVLLSSDDTHPAELFAADGRQITHHNDAWLAAHKLAATRELDFKSKDGTEIHGFVVTPPDFDAAKKYPAILRIHGGPVSQFSHRFNFEWQLFATNGYVVVAANPRGSSGRGEAFSKAIWADWGHLDAQDVLAAVDTIVARGLADPNRLGVGGWSYGGMLTNYVIAQDRRFKAATSGASISNILAGYGTDEYVREYELELGRPWEHPEIWTKHLVPVSARRPHHDSDALPRRRQGLQRAAAQQRADVPGAALARRPDGADHLSRPVPRHHEAELRARPLSALPGLVRAFPEVALGRQLEPFAIDGKGRVGEEALAEGAIDVQAREQIFGVECGGHAAAAVRCARGMAAPRREAAAARPPHSLARSSSASNSSNCGYRPSRSMTTVSASSRRDASSRNSSNTGSGTACR
jgi:poly(3-hydroxybutyrate) depolymerase